MIIAQTLISNYNFFKHFIPDDLDLMEDPREDLRGEEQDIVAFAERLDLTTHPKQTDEVGHEVTLFPAIVIDLYYSKVGGNDIVGGFYG